MLNTLGNLVKVAIANAPVALAAAPEIQSAILAGMDLYRALRDHAGQSEPDAMTDADLAQLLQDKGLSLRVNGNHFLADFGFETVAPAS
jgi:hypothetical protein